MKFIARVLCLCVLSSAHASLVATPPTFPTNTVVYDTNAPAPIPTTSIILSVHMEASYRIYNKTNLSDPAWLFVTNISVPDARCSIPITSSNMFFCSEVSTYSGKSDVAIQTNGAILPQAAMVTKQFGK